MNKTSMRRTTATAICSMLAVSLAACGSSNSASPKQATPAESQDRQGQAPQPIAPAAAGKDEAWKAEWSKIVEEAKKEGEVVIYSQPVPDREASIMAFEKAYPDIKVKFTGMRPAQSAPRIVAEQKQGKYLSDLYFEVPPGTLPADTFINADDYIVNPELRKDETWHGGYRKGFEMNNNTGMFGFAVLPTPTIYVNNDVIPEGEIKTIDDLLDPKYKGKIIIATFDKAAQGSLSMTALYMMKGEDFVRKLSEDQQPGFTFDTRQIVEWWATGKYPIAIGTGTANVRQFTERGIPKKFSKLEPPSYTATNPLTLLVLKNLPHPNAAKVFIDWFLSKEGQTTYVQNTKDFVSRRKDVPPVQGFSGFEKIDLSRSQFDAEGLKAMNWILEYGKKLEAKNAANTANTAR